MTGDARALRALADRWDAEASQTDGGLTDGLCQAAAELRELLDADPLADYVPVYLTDGGVTDEAAILDRILFLLGKMRQR